MDCGPTCLRMISKYYGKNYEIGYLRDISLQSGDGTTLEGIADAVEKIGLSTLALVIDYNTLSEQIPLPCIAHWRQRHYVVIYEATPEKVIVADPAFGLYPSDKPHIDTGVLNT